MSVNRAAAISRVARSFRVHPAVALVGPRQCGKTTLARMICAAESRVTSFDLEAARSRRQLETPEQTLGPLEGLVVIDEIQRQPELFETLRVLVDRPGTTTRFLLLGSASPTLARGASETLAGRVGRVNLAGFDLTEVGEPALGGWRKLWLRGGFPRSFLAESDDLSALWRESFIQSFLELDIPQFGISIPSEALRRFWMMVAHYHGQTWNAAEFARAIGANRPAARRYLDLLSDAHMVRVLPPWHENLKKRQIRSPKVYIRDTGLLHALLFLPTPDHVAGHPKVGASFEGFAIEQLISCLNLRNVHFWGTQGGAELDLLVTAGGRRYGFEMKYSDAPGSSRSMRIALDDLGLERLWIIYPGDEPYDIDDRIKVLPVADIPSLGEELGHGG